MVLPSDVQPARLLARELIIRPFMWNAGIEYQMLELLGEGGQGRVFKALRRDREAGLCETIALKVLHSRTAVDLWKQEFESLRKVRSPYCVQVLSFDRIDRKPALVLEFVDGVSLSQLGRSCLLDDSDIDEILAQIEAALIDLREFGLFHGDLSPGNVLIDRSGTIKLLDFGLANGIDRLTPDFAAPERLNGQTPNFFTDLYSLGAVESFLRGKPAGTDYTHHDPQMRRARGRASTPEQRQKLRDKVNHYLARSQWSRKVKTKTLQVILRAPQPMRRAVLLGVLAGVLITASSARSNFSLSQPSATLMLRTLKWHHFLLNGHPLGYAPLTVTLSTGREMELSWTSANGSGRKALRAQPGQRIVMDDSDFAPKGGIHEPANRPPENPRNSRR